MPKKNVGGGVPMGQVWEPPPRMLKRYSDCKLPLELTEQELLSDEATLSEARQKLTSDGWKQEGVYCSATWNRMRFMASVLYETIMEFEYQVFDDKTVYNLLQLEKQLQATWSSFPDRLRYKPEVWHTKEHPAACLMLAILNLLYLQSKLLIHRLLTRANISYTGPTLEIASKILSTVNHLAQVRDRAVFLRHDNPYVMLCYGLPGAAVVVEAISKNGVNNLPAVSSRAKLIRDLSVFVSHLEGICQPGEANHRLCTRAARVISKTLDEVLDLNAAFTDSGNTLARSDEDNSTLLQPQPLSPSRSQSVRGSDELALSSGYNAFDSLDQFDLYSWLKSVDWTGAGGEYTF
ncbi:hypothetical protein Slin14017_G031450 [Septoria linicola]|nr:hypothetical protein Slin14017_G031450 [Septoria linicola]